MRPSFATSCIIRPTLELMEKEFGIPASDDAARILLAITLQESGLKHRVQVPVDHAHGLWQFEAGGGVRGVLNHAATSKWAASLCEELLVKPVPSEVWNAIVHNDTLACAFARLLLWTMPGKLPRDEAGAWAEYIGAWRPGKPDRERWTANWRAALLEVPL